MTEEQWVERYSELSDKLTALTQAHQQAVEALKQIAHMNQNNLRTQLDTGDTLRIAGAMAKMFNDCRDIATAALATHKEKG